MEGSGTPEVVPGPLGVGTVVMGAVGVARDEQRAAAVSATGQNLYVASLTADGELAPPVVTSAAKKAADRLSAPSWDGRGDLWVADRDPARPRLLRLAEGRARRRRSVSPAWTVRGSRSCGCRRTGCGSPCC